MQLEGENLFQGNCDWEFPESKELVRQYIPNWEEEEVEAPSSSSTAHVDECVQNWRLTSNIVVSVSPK